MEWSDWSRTSWTNTHKLNLIHLFLTDLATNASSLLGMLIYYRWLKTDKCHASIHLKDTDSVFFEKQYMSAINQDNWYVHWEKIPILSSVPRLCFNFCHSPTFINEYQIINRSDCNSTIHGQKIRPLSSHNNSIDELWVATSKNILEPLQP